MRSQKKGGIILSYFNTVLNMCMNLILIPMLISALTDNDYSLYKVMQSFTGPLMMFNLGMSTVVARCVAQHQARGTKESQLEKENTFAMAVIISVAMAALVILIGTAMLQLLPVMFGKTYSSYQLEEARKLLLIFVCTTALHIVNDTFRGGVLGRERFYFLYGTTTMRYIIRFASIILLIHFTELSVIAIATVDLVIYALLLLVNILYTALSLQERIHLYAFRKNDIIAITSFSLAILLQAVVNQVNDNMDTVILGAMVAEKQVITMYSSALSIYTIYNSLISVLAGVYLPKATHLVARGASGEELTEFVVNPGRIQAVIAIAILGAFGLFGQTFIHLWIGEQYGNAYYIALALMIPVTVPLVQNVCLSILDAKLKRLFRSAVLIIMAIANVVTSVILVKQIGYWGATIGTILSLIIGHVILMNIYYAKRIEIDVIRMFKGIFKGILPAGLLSVLICFPLSAFLCDTWFGLLIGCAAFVTVYAVFIWKIGLNNIEKNLVKSSFTRNRKERII